MVIKQLEFKGSFPSLSKSPRDGKNQFAFIGRSNVGKSSLINMLCGRKELARVSKKPGKTQLLNFYLINNHWYLVDLPGYGYAKTSKTQRKSWEKMIQGYLVKGEALQCAMVLIDANIPPQKIDMEFINWLGEMRIPFVIVYTKTDRLSVNQLAKNLNLIRKELEKTWNSLPEEFVTSTVKGLGKEDILEFIQSVNERT